MADNKYYSNERLLNTLDRNGEKPELYMVCSRVRGPGKTYSFSKKLMTDFMERGEKFVLLCRTQGMLGGIAEGVFKSYVNNEMPNTRVTEVIQMSRTYSNVILVEKAEGSDDEIKKHIGYVIPLSASDKIKLISSTFVDASQGYFDEFQPEDRHTYLNNEVDKFLSIHGSLARGGGEQRRYFPFYFASNSIDLVNPYFSQLGLTNKIQNNTRFYKGDGFVYEFAENNALAEKHKESAMSRAFNKNKSIDYNDGGWLLNNNAFIAKPDNWGRANYMCTLVNEHGEFAIKWYSEVQWFFVDRNVDKSCALRYSMVVDGELNIPFIKSDGICRTLRKAVEGGRIRFKDQSCKRVIMDLFI